MSADLIEAAGAVVLRAGSDPGQSQVLVVHRPRYDDWSLPKGKLDHGECPPVAAVREVAEETGVRIRLAAPLDATHYRVGKHDKRVHWWIGVPVGEPGPVTDTHEVDEVAWWPTERAIAELTQAADRALVAQASAEPSTTPLMVLRHGKATDRKSWKHDDGDRPLAARGREQADELVALLASYGVRQVATSPWKRCVQTVTPYAEQAGARLQHEPALTEKAMRADPTGVAPVMRRLARQAADGASTVVCGHRPVLPLMFEAIDLVDRWLDPASAVVAHYTADGEVRAIEVHAVEA